MKLSLSVLLLASTAFVAMGCSVETDDSSAPESDDVSVDEAIAAKVAPGSFKLADTAGQAPNPKCDVYTRLDLKAGTYSSATLTEQLDGTCRMFVAPNERTYRLKAAGGSCGSHIYTGSMKKAGQSYAIKITDHRSRVCLDVQPATVIVEETVPGFPGAITTTKYSRTDGVLACPSTKHVDCMPGPNRRLSNLCPSDARDWVKDNCPGVYYTF